MPEAQELNGRNCLLYKSGDSLKSVTLTGKIYLGIHRGECKGVSL